MTSSWDRLSDHHTFSQRYGYEPLPESMRLEEISKDLRREIFNAIRGLFSATETASIGGYMSTHREFVEDGARFVERIFRKWFRITEDKVGKLYDIVIGWTSDIMWSTEFYKILNFLEILVNDKKRQLRIIAISRLHKGVVRAARRRLPAGHVAASIPVLSYRQRRTRRCNAESHRSSPRRQHGRRDDTSASSRRTHQCTAICRLDRGQHPCRRIRCACHRSKVKQDPRSGVEIPRGRRACEPSGAHGCVQQALSLHERRAGSPPCFDRSVRRRRRTG